MGFKITNDTDTNFGGTYQVALIKANFKDLENLFGPAHEDDNHKVSGVWYFVDDDNNIITVYDWKQTTLYDASRYTIEQFRNLEVAEFSVGSNSNETANLFNEWLQPQLSSKKYSFITLKEYRRKVAQIYDSLDENNQQSVLQLIDNIY